MPVYTVKLKPEAMEFGQIGRAADAISRVLQILYHNDPVQVAATARAIMQEAANVELTAKLKALNERKL